MIKITSINENNNIVHREYDNMSTNFYQEGRLVELDLNIQQPSGSHECGDTERCGDTADRDNHPQFSKEDIERMSNRSSATHKASNPTTLKIQMGLTCNFNCAYCIQGQFGSRGIISNDDVDKWIDNFDTWCTSKKDNPMGIQLWGGEPLLYMDCIKRLVIFLHERFTNSRISVVSNGSLLTKDIADFFIENYVEFVVSHDGPTNLKNRTLDPLAEGSESLKWIKYLNDHKSRQAGVIFNAVITKDNHDIQSIIDHIKGIMGDRASVNFEGIVTVEDRDIFSDDMLYTDKDYLELRENIIKMYASGSLQGVAPFQQKFDGLLFNWFHPDRVIEPGSFQKCGMDNPYTLGLNLHGDVLKCHSTTEVIGNVDNLDIVDLYSGVTRWEQRDECKECIVLSLCKGACMLVDEKSWAYTCNNEFNFNMAVFESVFEYVFKERIVRIDGLNHRP